MATSKKVVESALQQAVKEVDRRVRIEHLSQVERVALAWMVLLYSDLVHPCRDAPSLVEHVVRHPCRYNASTVKGLMLASPIARALLAARISYSPNRAQIRRIESIYSQLIGSTKTD